MSNSLLIFLLLFVLQPGSFISAAAVTKEDGTMTENDDAMAKKLYTADWESLDARPLPSWYDEAKIGIFMHFGPYAVPGVQSEWFWLQSVRKGGPNDYNCANYLKDYFPPKWTYQNFGPQLTMDFFDAEQFADIVADSGAKYLVFTSKHHDGYCNWPSTYSYGWNSMDVGPRRDVVGELKKAFDKKHPDLHFGLYYSLYEWFNPIYLKDKANNFTTREYALNKMWPEMQELVTKYEPHILWVDGDWETYPPYWGSQEFLAWMYNESPSKDHIVTNDRWGIGTFKTHGDFYSGPDRFDPGTLQAHKWENAMSIDGSWGYRRNINLEDLYSMKGLIKKVARAVSNGGNILINVGPTKEGTIIPIFQERLHNLGQWLKVNGDAIYKSRPWTYQNDTLDGNVWYTRRDDHVYGIVLEWPEDDVLELGDPVVGDDTEVEMLGLEGELLKIEVTGNGSLGVSLPRMSLLVSRCGEGCQWGYVLRFKRLINLDRTEEDEEKLERKRKEEEEERKKREEEEEEKRKKEEEEEEEEKRKEELMKAEDKMKEEAEQKKEEKTKESDISEIIKNEGEDEEGEAAAAKVEGQESDEVAGEE